eukprot:GHVS01078572.1.p1 GENE.GHVS01078572.1~~GHVS01078572.1.p1  ORF type:complete len:381 (+),score=84.74 GHVS01078572.1:257-1399(+)
MLSSNNRGEGVGEELRTFARKHNNSKYSKLYTDESTDAFTGIHEAYLEDVSWGDEEDESCANDNRRTEQGTCWLSWCWKGDAERERLLLLADNNNNNGGLADNVGGLRSVSSSSGGCCWRVCVVAKQICNFIFCIIAGLSLCIGITTLVVDGSNIYKHNYLVFIYICTTLVGELLILLSICVLIMLLKVCVGEVYSAHANAMCGISLKALQGLYYYTAVGLGMFILIGYRDSWLLPTTNQFTSFGQLHLMFTSDNNNNNNNNNNNISTTSASSSPPSASPISSSCGDLPFSSLVYIVCVVLLSLLFTANSCPVIIGGVGWLIHKVQMKVLGRAEVTFHEPTTPVTYASIQQYSRAVGTMHNPMVVVTTAETPTTTQQQGN